MVEQYWGPDKIKDTEINEDKTYFGLQRVFVNLENGTKLDLPMEVFKTCITPVASDLTELRERKVVPVVGKILALLTEAELTNDEITHAVSKLKLSIDDAYEKGAEILWGKENNSLNLYDVEKVFRKENQKNENIGTAQKSDNDSTDKRKINGSGRKGKSGRPNRR